MRIDSTSGCWIHHNDISGSDGPDDNSAQIKMYTNFQCLVEDNYVHNGHCGIHDKVPGGSNTSGGQNTFRRNLIDKCYGTSFDGNVDNAHDGTHPMLDYIYDNVINSPGYTLGDQPIDLEGYGSGTQIYNNLITVPSSLGNYATAYGSFLCIRGDQSFQTVPPPANNPAARVSIWNNIYLARGEANVRAVHLLPALTGIPKPLDYCDYNVYDCNQASLTYLFNLNNDTYSFAQIRATGYETQSQVIPSSHIFTDQTSYTLQSAFQTAGRFGDFVGPRTTVDGLGNTVSTIDILNLNRYGPQAIGNYT